MKKNILLCFLLLTGVFLHAQAPPPPPPPAGHDTTSVSEAKNGNVQDSLADSVPYTFAEKMPVFPGGQSAWVDYLHANVHYPEYERKHNIQGVVYVSFIIEKDGSVSNVEVKKGVPGGPGLSEEAVRVISQMPNWSPGTMNGKPVRVQVTQPIRFAL